MAKRVRGEGLVRQHGRKWQASIQIKGKRYWGTFLKKEDAHDWLTTLKADEIRGVLKIEDKPTELRFDDICRLYKVHKLPRWRPGSASYFDCHVKGVLLPAFEHRPISSLTTFELQTFLDKKLDTVAGSTVNKYHQVLTAVLKHAVKMGFLARSPMDGVEKAREEGEGARSLKMHEIQAFFRTIRPEDRPFYTILFFCGLRRSEIFRMTWKWVDLEEGMLRVLVAKRGSSEIPMAECVKKAFQELVPAADGLVFPGHRLGHRPGDPVDTTKMLTAKRKSLLTNLTRAGINPDRISPHSFRHTFRTLLEETGAPYGVAHALGRWGKRGKDMSARYLHPSDELLRHALAQLEARVFERSKVIPFPQRAAGQ